VVYFLTFDVTVVNLDWIYCTSL